MAHISPCEPIPLAAIVFDAGADGVLDALQALGVGHAGFAGGAGLLDGDRHYGYDMIADAPTATTRPVKAG